MDLTDHHLSEVKRLDAEPSVGPMTPDAFLDRLRAGRDAAMRGEYGVRLSGLSKEEFREHMFAARQRADRDKDGVDITNLTDAEHEAMIRKDLGL